MNDLEEIREGMLKKHRKEMLMSLIRDKGNCYYVCNSTCPIYLLKRGGDPLCAPPSNYERALVKFTSEYDATELLDLLI